MTTARSIIEGAFRLCGISSPSITQLENALTVLNDMLALWSAERLMVPYVVEESFTLTTGISIYTIGAGGDFDTVRPIRIVDAYLRDSANIDYSVITTMSLEEYNSIRDKNTQARPEKLYYSPEYPLGKIHFDSKPDQNYTFKIFSWKPLSSFQDLDANINMPSEYLKTMRLSLAVELAPELNVRLDPLIVQQAVGAHMMIRNLNRPKVPSARHDKLIIMELNR